MVTERTRYKICFGNCQEHEWYFDTKDQAVRALRKMHNNKLLITTFEVYELVNENHLIVERIDKQIFLH